MLIKSCKIFSSKNCRVTAQPKDDMVLDLCLDGH